MIFGSGGVRLPETLLQIAGVRWDPARWKESVLLLVDAQEFYRTGRLRLCGIDAAIAQAEKALTIGREQGTPVIHVVQQSRPGSDIFNEEGCRILRELTPLTGEVVVEKAYPDSFASTTLQHELERIGRKDIIVLGFMTHMCVSTTVRSAMHRGYRCTLIAGACATRDLPDTHGGVVEAETLHRAELAALADRFAIVVESAETIEA